MKSLLPLILPLSCIAIVGCAPLAPKHIYADKDAYLKNFVAEEPSKEVKAYFEGKDRSAKKFQSVEIIDERVLRKLDATKLATSAIAKRTIHLVDLGSGMISGYTQIFNGEIPSSLIYHTEYKGIFSIAKQPTNLRVGGVTDFPTRVVSVKSLDVLPARPQINTTYTMENNYRFGPKFSFHPDYDWRITCTTGTYYAASVFYKDLTGDAIDMDCKGYNNGIQQFQSQDVFIVDLGMAIQRKLSTADYEMISTVQSINIKN